MEGAGSKLGPDGGAMQDEKQFTPHAELGWLSWDEWSPEQDFCRFVGMLQRMLQPAIVVETGVGVGRLTGHLDLGSCTYLGYESDNAWRQPPANQKWDSPGQAELEAADMLILDSAPDHRIVEFDVWAEHGKPGSVCIVHDCGNGHAPGTIHAELRAVIEVWNIPGVFLKNPRGGWMGVHG
jgi:hypothetical protein